MLGQNKDMFTNYTIQQAVEAIFIVHNSAGSCKFRNQSWCD